MFLASLMGMGTVSRMVQVAGLFCINHTQEQCVAGWGCGVNLHADGRCCYPTYPASDKVMCGWDIVLCSSHGHKYSCGVGVVVASLA